MANRLPAEGQKSPLHSILTWQEDGETLRAIPTTDPTEALRFCQALAHALDSRHAPFSNRSNQTALALTPEEHPYAIPQPDLSVVIPVHNEQENLPTLYDRLTQVLQQQNGLTYELLFIDDGSNDNSINVLRQFAQKDAQVIVVELTRNFGHQAAISAGLDHSAGRAVTIMDADLQDPPELLLEFLTKWQEGYEVVYAIRGTTQRVLATEIGLRGILSAAQIRCFNLHPRGCGRFLSDGSTRRGMARANARTPTFFAWTTQLGWVLASRYSLQTTGALRWPASIHDASTLSTGVGRYHRI